jgi:predicted nucleic acid-binding Zn ribbon protein
MTPRRRSPRPMADLVRQAVGRAEPATLLAMVQTAWAPAVGEKIAKEATPVAEREGVVTVACRSATWANELELMGPEIAQKLRAELPSSADLRGFRFSAARDPG